MAFEQDIRAALKHVLDAEIGISIVDSRALIMMTMPSPACPLADYHVPDVG